MSHPPPPPCISVNRLSFLILFFFFIFSESAIGGSSTPPHSKRCVRKCGPEFLNDGSMNVTQVVSMSGRSVRLNCSFEANPPATVKWLKNGKKLERRKYGEAYEARSDHLYIENLDATDEGEYTCEVRNNISKIEHSYLLIVGEAQPFPPLIDDSLFHSRIDILLGENVTLECEFESLAAASFSFLRYNGTTEQWLILQDSLTIDDEVESHYFPIFNFSEADEGDYACWASNNYGTSKRTIKLELHPLNYTVNDRPQPVTARIQSRDPTYEIGLALGTLFACILLIYLFVKMREYQKNQITVVHAEQSFIIRRVVSLEHDNGGKCLSPRVKIETETVNLNQLGAAEKKRALNEYQLPLDKDWEVTRDRLVIAEKLGEGAFGVVFKAAARDMDQKDEKAMTEVAVKMLKDSHTDSDLRDLVSEMEVMKKVGRHTNIISLLGCVTQEGPPCVIVEFAANGNLKDWLRKHSPTSSGVEDAFGNTGKLQKDPQYISVQKLLDYASQIAKGMRFLSSQNCIHRDLAARNVLVTADQTMKIADFGLARDLVNRDYYLKSKDDRRLPVRWMAPEALFKTKYTCQSDVWSFGVVLWELFSFGMDPYPGLDLWSLQPLYAILKSGQRMPKPDMCPSEVYSVMHWTWAEEPDQRPTFGLLVDKLDEMLSRFSSAEYLDLSLFAPLPQHMCYTIDMSDDRFAQHIRVYENQTQYTNHAIISNQSTKANPSYFNPIRPIAVPCPMPPAQFV